MFCQIRGSYILTVESEKLDQLFFLLVCLTEVLGVIRLCWAACKLIQLDLVSRSSRSWWYIIEDDKVSLDIHLIFSMANCMHNYPTSIINANMILYSCLSLKLALLTNVDQQLYLMGALWCFSSTWIFVKIITFLMLCLTATTVLCCPL